MDVLIIRTDGREETIKTTRGRCFKDIERTIAAECLDGVALDRGTRTMFVDDNGWETETVEHGPGHVELRPTKARKPVNAKATALYHEKCGGVNDHQIVGDVAIVKETDFED